MFLNRYQTVSPDVYIDHIPLAPIIIFLYFYCCLYQTHTRIMSFGRGRTLLCIQGMICLHQQPSLYRLSLSVVLEELFVAVAISHQTKNYPMMMISYFLFILKG